LRATDRGDPTYEGVQAEHETYVEALGSAGVDVITLPPLEQFPDSVFVEDPALVFPEGAILLRPGAPSRAGEGDALAPVLGDLFDAVLELPEPGFADGGDVLQTPRGVIIGLSSRTDRAGAEGLAACLAQFGRDSTIVETPPGVLHFKSGCSMVEQETVLCTPALARSGIFDGYRTIVTPEGEDAAANALRVNDRVILGSGFRGRPTCSLRWRSSWSRSALRKSARSTPACRACRCAGGTPRSLAVRLTAESA
jgi:dimethylargininase